METVTDKLKEYFSNTPEDKILSDWDKSKEWDNVGVPINEFINSQRDIDPDIKDAGNGIYWGLLDNDEI